MKVLASLLLILASFTVYSQKSAITIQQVELKDSILIKSIKEVVEGKLINDSLKLKHYYLSLYIQEYPHGDTLIKYTILINGYAFKKEDADNLYPPFYSYVGDKVVLIYINGFKHSLNYRYKNSSKRKLRMAVNKLLEKEKQVTFYDDNNHIAFVDKKYREDYLFRGAINIYTFRKRKPVITFSPE